MNTTFLLAIKNKETLIRYCKTSFFVAIFRNGKTEKLCYSFINYCDIFFVGISSSLLAHRRRCWSLGFDASSPKLSLSASRRRRCLIVVSSGVPSCGYVHHLLHLVVGGVLLLSSAAASPLSKLTYHFVHKF